jgi:hypothetical protein
LDRRPLLFLSSKSKQAGAFQSEWNVRYGKLIASETTGKCGYEGTTVTPDTRRGLLYLDQQDDGLLHLYWKDRKTSATEDDLIIFPDEAELVPIPNKRVFVLKFKSSSQRLFYWIQEVSADKDEETMKKFNKIMNGDMGDQPGL